MKKQFYLIFIILFVLILFSQKKNNYLINNTNYIILNSYPYDKNLFTEGLEVFKNKIIVGSGKYGKSLIGQLSLDNGELQNELKLDPIYFGEGITFTDNDLWQLTWKEGIVFKRDTQTFKVKDSYLFEGEGWGICYDGKNLINSDGTDILSIRSSKDFKLIKKLKIKNKKIKVGQLNELEYANGYIYSNVFNSSNILKIDPVSGNVLKTYDLSLLFEDKSINKKEVLTYGELNGIAHLNKNKFYISGKNWSRIFLLELK
ncbi:hypothetical protein CKN63_13510 [Carnobacterium divergens]|uniref:glutaminyl-peptide cyclotransferase n=1 Tax=Carnobacterium divergens TaxID=2748 RepID=UPI001071D61E|nr:glutaminyl-peptide cyclotransferase [Carnobacterium divergens]TFI60575.1 hypothetical protein CKN59_13445 [Carnobacterium divergens]TFI61626.1 hypothetical protein CKN76_12540 [Carnobacterium divergens]TFJ01050.1 hypothetical protein CKN75_13035 [Carnobacterium divergens]TFJ08970.1 hypothetical protein CKN71_13050 [Carnobacterium divergens]TFJ15679.1 hypothetical protein CKN63_13510 [Carnobacterium divergens]